LKNIRKIRTFLAFINILLTIHSSESFGASANVKSLGGIRVANGARLARIRSARVVQMTQKADFSWRTFAMECRHSVPTRSAVKAGLAGAIVDIPFAVPTFPSVHASAQKASVNVVTSGAVLTNVRMVDAFINVRFTKPT
jgi:hypothetical protein